jgi:hypothetical protein
MKVGSWESVEVEKNMGEEVKKLDNGREDERDEVRDLRSEVRDRR